MSQFTPGPDLPPPRYPTSSSTPPAAQSAVPGYGPSAPWQPVPLGPAPTTWPMVLGIIMIVLGGLSSCVNIWGLVGPLVMPALMGMTPGQDANTRATVDAMTQYRVPLMVSAAVNLILAAMLLIAGIMLVRRQQGAAKLSVLYAWLRFIAVIFGAVVTFLMQRMQFASMSTAAPPGMNPQTFINAVAVISLVFMLLWGWAMPVFLLIWFSRRKIKDEVALWQ